MIADDAIDQIRARANLADIIGESVKLTRKGRSLLGLCPFHKEKSPSFNVNEERGFYHCFGCKASGDVFKFVQETEGLTFMEAVRSLAERTGVELIDDLSGDERKRRAAEKREEALYDVSRTAALFYQQMLETHALAHFAHAELKKRGLPYKGPAKPVLESFAVGYAPDSWDALSLHLTKAGHDLRAAEAVGLLVTRRQGNGYYDRFRHRLMFAIVDVQGRTVGFSGRALPPAQPNEDEAPAKYINSPESPIYSKRSTVFGLYQARNTLRSGTACVLVEGNFDVVSLHAAGFSQTVAPLGTAFTVEQGRLIRRFTPNVTLLFDGDGAGKKAAIASREPARESDLYARVARLPEGVDPDDFVRKRGPEALSSLLGAASGMLDYLIEETLDERFVAADAKERGERINRVVQLLKSEDDPNVRALAQQHADRLAGRLGVDLGVDNARTFHELRASIEQNLRKPTGTGLHAGNRAAEKRARQSSLGKSILGAVLDFPQMLDDERFLESSIFFQGELAAAIACLRGGTTTAKHPETHPPGAPNSARPELHRILDRLPSGLRDFAAQRLAAPRHEQLESARVELFANLDKLRRMELTRASSSTLGEMERARREGDFEQELALLQQQVTRARGKRGL